MPASSDFSLLWQLILPQRTRLLMALFFAALAAPLTLLPWAILAELAARVLAASSAHLDLYAGAGLLVLAQVARYGAGSLAYYFSHVAAFELLMSLRQQAVTTLAAMPLPALQRFSSGDLKKRVMLDIERLEQFIAHHSVELLTALLTPLFALGLLCWLDYRLALTALLPLPLAAMSQAVLMRQLTGLMQQFNRGQAALNNTLVEYIRALPTMQLFGQHSRSFTRLQRSLADYQRSLEQIVRQTVPGWSLFTVLINSGVLALVPVTLYLLQTGDISASQAILALMTGAAMLQPLMKVAKLGSELKEITVGARQLQPLLQPATNPAYPAQTAAATTCQPGLRLQGVAYTYDTQPILKPLSISIAAGQFLAITGPSGSGKTTLVQLICGLLTAESGEISWEGQNLTTLTNAQRCQLITLVGQQQQLFSCTLRRNLLLGYPPGQQATDSELWQALEIAQVAERVQALPDQLDTVLDEQSRTLSGGERQRICIARALLCPAPVLILDEATAFADVITERRFYHQLRQSCPDRTLIVVTHRQQAVLQADQIALLADGQLLDCGTHAALLNRSRLYRQLWQQREGDSDD